MRYGTREICNVVLKDIKTKKPVVYLESLTTTSLESKASTVYAKGGRGNAKLIGWDSERELTFKMEDALISKASLGVLTGGQFKSSSKPIHKKEVLTVSTSGSNKIVTLSSAPTSTAGYTAFFYRTDDGSTIGEELTATLTGSEAALSGTPAPKDGDLVIVDYYYNAPVGAQTLEITSDKFAGTYMLEAETLWRNEDGIDVPAIFTIPKLKIQNEWTIEMTPTGDPKPFSFSAEALKDRKSNTMVLIDVIED